MSCVCLGCWSIPRYCNFCVRLHSRHSRHHKRRRPFWVWKFSRRIFKIERLAMCCTTAICMATSSWQVHNFKTLNEHIIGHIGIVYGITCLTRHQLTWQFKLTGLSAIDEMIRAVISYVINVDLTGPACEQASLPVRIGSLGVRRIRDLALPCFI